LAGKGLSASRLGVGQFRLTLQDSQGTLKGFEFGVRQAGSAARRCSGGAWSAANGTFDFSVIDDCPLSLVKSTADATASTATSETLIGTVHSGLPVGHIIKINPAAALTADNTNYATITVQKRTNGGAAVTIASANTKITGGTGNWTAFAPISVSLTAAASPGDTITYSISKSGTGVVVPALTLDFAGLQDMAADPDNELSVSLWFGSDADV
jgi:hypothetical protein